MNGLLSIPGTATAASQRGPAGGDGRLFRLRQGRGRLAAAWELYKAQEAIVAACARARRADHAVSRPRRQRRARRRSDLPRDPVAAPGSVDGTLRVTEQGEMIQAKFGLPGIALRTLEVYTTATLDATLAAAAPRSATGARTMDASPRAARAAFGASCTTTRDSCPISTATPEAELARCTSAAGRRAARRRRRSRPCARFPGSSPGPRPGCCCRRGSAPRSCSAAR